MRLYLHNKSVASGRDEGTNASKKQIEGFVKAYDIDMQDFTPSNIEEYSTFEDFFTRAHAPGSRPIHEPENGSTAVVVADSRVVVYETLSAAKSLWIKGKEFSISTLSMDTQIGQTFDGGAAASFRLSPQDYHRYHSPVMGKIQLFRSVPGSYYQVDPIALQSDVDILSQNRREYILINSEEFGQVLFVAIGATNVGTVQ
jgi:phosphatidylserine decarboxylase